MKIGVISDTHDYFDPVIPNLFRGVDHIIHGGDVGAYSILQALQEIAPVTAVLGNTDGPLPLKLTELIRLNGRKFLIHHIVDPRNPTPELKQRITTEAPEVVVFGHSHKPFAATVGKVLFFNPGYAGKRRFNQDRSVAILDCFGPKISHQFIPLD